ncbi:MAG: DEAD/DEAH box helicase [Pyrinomonadaceae bacterium]
MKEINVHTFSTRLNATFRRYLATTNLIADSEPYLRDEVWAQLGKPDLFFRKPLVTAIHSYKQSCTGASILGSNSVPHLSSQLRNLNPLEFDLNRPLYEHQLKSLEKSQNGRSIVVATGTGSGKTECFLLPVLDDVVASPAEGVRSIIVYPMNALANDQLDRLRRLLKDLPEITFGRYTGETPQTRAELSEEELEAISPNERFSRDEIQNNPPRILLTNFAMLEYLLLRPTDASIFRHHSLRYVVLDEAHSYNGAQGIDISLLMRRLSQRYNNNKLQFILTSATLTQEDDAASREGIAGFGYALTGANFATDDIIFGETVTGFSTNLRPVEPDILFSAVPDEVSLQKWLEALDKPSDLKQLIHQAQLPNSDKVDSHQETASILYELFKDWLPLQQIHERVSEKPQSFDDLTMMLWERDDVASSIALEWLLIMSSGARKSADSQPLLPARFHFFYRGISGASVCLSLKCECSTETGNSVVKRVYLENRARCDSPCESLLLPLSTCFQCGMPCVSVYLTENSTRWQALSPSNSYDTAPRRLFLTWSSSFSDAEESETDNTAVSESDVHLCLSCNAIDLDNQDSVCCDSPRRIKLSIIATGKDGNVKTCPRCGTSSRPHPSVLREFRSGGDAVTAVLAEQIVRHLPEGDECPDSLPAGGRRMLAFSDSRQRAAFFAPYLKRTTAETEYARPLYEALQKEESALGEAVDINTIAKRFVREATSRKQIVLREYDADLDIDTYRFIPTGELLRSDRRNLERQAVITLLKHFCATPRQRTTWIGLALASSAIELTASNVEDLKNDLPELFEDAPSSGFDLIQQLLQVLLMKRAIYIEDEGINNQDLGKGAKEVTVHYSHNDSVDGRSRVRWNPYKASRIQERTILGNYQANIIAKYFGLNLSSDGQRVDEWLERVWQAFRKGIIRQYEAGGGGEYQVDARRIVVSTSQSWSVCDSCGRLTVWHLSGECNTPRCSGRLKELGKSELEAKFLHYHYRHRILNDGPMALNVVEHTAQLTNAHGQDYQKQFVRGAVNVLSSSTTFEMGVDVGGLKAVLLRNVPPTASNYIQRAGRAGRRKDGAAYAITFARSLPHDQYYFHNPSAVVNGKVPVPLINLQNTRLAERHINSLLLSEFLRSESGDSDVKRVRDFFFGGNDRGSPYERYIAFLNERSDFLINMVESILPLESQLDAALCVKKSGDDLRIVETEKVREPLNLFKEQWEQINRQRHDADARQLRAIGYALDSIERLIMQVEDDYLINFLSSAHWLPSYAFPQDTIRLLVRQTNWTDKMRLERDRDQGISEYAPGAEIIADGRNFKSAGVIKPGNGFDIRRYRYCRNCRRLATAMANDALPPTCECGSYSPVNNYIVPTGFQTLFSEQVKEPDLFRRRPPSSTEIFLVNGTSEEEFSTHPVIPDIKVGYRRDGKLFRANAGYEFKKFRLCQECGREVEGAARTHETPWATRCTGSLFQTHLAHEFETDILQLRFGFGALRTPPVSDSEFWLSFLSAFVSASAEVLAIPLNDLDAIYQSQSRESAEGELIIFDRVPGGAGYVERIIENLPSILDRVRERTMNCDNPLCDVNGSCYTCLRNYKNQFNWDKLVRRKIVTWLGSFAAETTAGE